MSQQALRHVRIARSRIAHCTRYTRSYSVQAAVKQLSQETEGSSHVASSSTHDASTNSIDQPLDHAPNTTTSPSRGKVTLDQSSSRTRSESSASRSRGKRQFLRTEAYLMKLSTEGVKPTIGDLERFRSDKPVRSNSPQYIEQHNEVLDTICRAFSKEQLAEFLDIYEVSFRRRATKIKLAETIIEKAWGWPSLAEIEKNKRERTEVSSRLFPMTRSQLFLVLGRDGLHMLELSREFNVNISLTSEPLALRVEGVVSSLNSLAKRLSELRESFVDEVYRLPTATPVPQELIQRISRLADAFLDNVGPNGEIKIYARSPAGLSHAKRLAARAVHEIHVASQIPLVSYKPQETAAAALLSSNPHTYALFPFLSPRGMPWTMNVTGAFRVRKVGEWLTHGQGEDIERTGGLTGGKGNIYSKTMHPVNLENAFRTLLPNANRSRPVAHSRKIKASLGHMLITTETSGRQPSLIPPLNGYHQYSRILNWMDHKDIRATFVASLPSSLANVNPSKERIVHRIVYQSYKSLAKRDGTKLNSDPDAEVTLPELQSITFEVVLSQPSQTPASEPRRTPESEPEVQDLEDLEFDDLADEDFKLSSSSRRLPQATITLSPQCRVESERIVDLMMPDRPLDMRLSFVDSTDLCPSDIPSELTEYLWSLQEFLQTTDLAATQPMAPLELCYNGVDYLLHSSASVRQSIDEVPPYDEGRDDPSLAVVSESIVDIESNQKATHCEIVSTDPISPYDWQEFLTTCDRLTTSAYNPAWKKAPVGGLFS